MTAVPQPYPARRETLRVCVVCAARIDPALRLRGSFHFGDFHLAAWSGESWSDVDLVAVGMPEARRAVLSSMVSDLVARNCGVLLPVSVHPAPTFSDLSADDARFLAIGEYLRRSPTAEGSARMDFLRAKICLLLARVRASERYLEVARRLDTPAARAAAAVRIGDARDFAVDAALDLVSTSGNQEAAFFAEACLAQPYGHDLVRSYVAQLHRRPGIDDWLRAHLAGLILTAWRA